MLDVETFSVCDVSPGQLIAMLNRRRRCDIPRTAKVQIVITKDSETVSTIDDDKIKLRVVWSGKRGLFG